jgi:hypothetical protein
MRAAELRDCGAAVLDGGDCGAGRDGRRLGVDAYSTNIQSSRDISIVGMRVCGHGYNIFIHARKTCWIENQTRTYTRGYKLTSKPTPYRVFTCGHVGKMCMLPSLISRELIGKKNIRDDLFAKSSSLHNSTYILSLNCM